MPDSPRPVLDIAAGVLLRSTGEVLIAQRRPGTDGAGKWEFPGGKLEPGENSRQALVRELREELGIEVRTARPLLAFSHDYSHRQVRLQMWLVTNWSGTPRGVEGQPLEWVQIRNLQNFDLLAANKPIVDALRLPSRYLITPDLDEPMDAFLAKLVRSVRAGNQLIRLRQTNMPDDAYSELAVRAQQLVGEEGGQLLLDRPAAVPGCAGVHLSLEKARMQGRAETPGWFGISCHGRAELLEALEMGADFATLSPLCKTLSHPETEPLGWAAFRQACAGLALPVYALGGLDEGDCEVAWDAGAQGVAAIRGFWPT